MSNYNVMGYGGIRIGGQGVDTAIFPNSWNEITYSPVIDSVKNGNGKIFYRFKGYRRIVECELFSITSGMYMMVQNLIATINSSMATNTPIYINMKWATGNTYLSLADMLLDSDFTLEDLVRVEGNQKVKLKFISQNLYQTIPSWTNAPQNTWVNEDDDIIVDGNENTLIFK